VNTPIPERAAAGVVYREQTPRILFGREWVPHWRYGESLPGNRLVHVCLFENGEIETRFEVHPDRYWGTGAFPMTQTESDDLDRHMARGRKIAEAVREFDGLPVP